MPDLEELHDTWEFIYLWIILKSIGISAFTAVIALIVGYPAAYYIARRGDRQKHFLLFLVTLPFFTNALVRMYAWILILRRDGVLNNALQGLGLTHGPLQMINATPAHLLQFVER